jgi:hypothetical protein
MRRLFTAPLPGTRPAHRDGRAQQEELPTAAPLIFQALENPATKLSNVWKNTAACFPILGKFPNAAQEV